MAFIYETYAEQKISAEANAMTEYIMKIRGIVPNYGNAFNLGSTGTILKIDQGMLVYTGRKAINNALEEIEVLPETLGTRTKYINVTLDGSQQPTANSATFNISNSSAGSITSKTEDLMDNLIGSVSFELGRFANTTSGIDNSTLQLTCPIILQRSLDELNDKFGSYLPLAGGTMSGSINMNANFIHLRTGVSIQGSQPGRMTLTGNIYTDYINTQGSDIQTAGGKISTNGGQLTTGGGLISTVGGQMFTNTLYLAQTTGESPAKVFEYRGTDSFFIQQRAFTKDINTQGNDIATDGGDIDTNGGELRIDGGNIQMDGGTLFFRSGVYINSPIAGRLNIVGSIFGGGYNSQGATITSGGGAIASNLYFAHDTNGSNGISIIGYRDGSSFDVLRNMYTKRILTQGNSINTQTGDIGTDGGQIVTNKGTISTQGGKVATNIVALHDTNGANEFNAIGYRDTSSMNVFKNMYTQRLFTQGNAINTQSGQIVTEGGSIGLGGGNLNTDGGYLSAFGNTVFANSLTLTDTNGTNGYKAVNYIDPTSFELLRKLFTKEIDTQGNSILTNGGYVNLGAGKLITQGTDYEQIISENATGPTGTKTWRLKHNTGQTAGLLSWDRSINGENACYFNMLSLTEGEPYNGLRMVENQRPYSYGNAKFLVEAATLFSAQVSNLEVSLSLQDQIDIINNSMQTMRSELDLLKLQMQAIINGEPIPTELPPVAMLRTADVDVEVTFADNLRSKLNEAQAELNEQDFQDKITVVDDQIKFMEKDLEAVNVKQTRSSGVDKRFELLANLKVKREEIIQDYGKGEA